MYFVDNENVTDPHVNLAIEEYLLRNVLPEEDILLFYINANSIIIGRHQNTIEEINSDVVDERKIQVVRRLSGGGAVYHDLGNLNFSFITQKSDENVHNFKKFTSPVITALHELGVQAELSGRNDILVDGRKISGNAQYVAARRMVSHGTLLYNADLSHVADALRVKAAKIESKGIKSVRSRVANISEFLPQPLPPIEVFREHILHSIFSSPDNVQQYHLTDEDWRGIRKLVEERYGRWDWNYGESPKFNIQKVERFASGEVDARLDVERGVIQSIRFFGDYFAEGDSAELEKRLTGVRYAREDLEQALADVNIGYYFGGLTLDEFLKFLY